MILIIDNRSAFMKKFKNNWLSDSDIPFRCFDHNEPLWIEDKSVIKGLILSGGKGNPYEPLNLTTNFVALMTLDVPVLGICLGHEILAVAHGGRVKKLPEAQKKREEIIIDAPDDPIFEGISNEKILLKEQHSFHVFKKPDNFITIGHSDVCPNEIIKHKEKIMYGFQSHPEVSGVDGIIIMRNFLKFCGYDI